MAPPKKRSYRSWLKLILVGCLITALIIAAHSFNLQELLQTSLVWVRSLGVLGPIAYIALYNLATVLFVPGSLLSFKGGCLFGLIWGYVYVLLAATLGAIAAFLMGRYFSRDWVCRKIEGNLRFKAVDEAVTREGWKIVFLTRLSPLFPFNLLNYAFGVTQVSLKDYILGSIGMVPGTVMYVYLGSLAGELATMPSTPTDSPEAQIARWTMRVVGLVATIALTLYTARIARKALF